MKFGRPYLYALIVVLICVRDFRHAVANFDMFGYIAASEAARGKNTDQIFSTVNDEVHLLTAQQRDTLLAVPYRRNVLSSTKYLSLAIPIYRAKPLYVAFIRGLQYLTRSYSVATLLPTVLAYIGIAAIVWFLVGRYNLILAILIMLQPAFLNVAHLRTPDLLATFVLLLGLYLCIGHQTILGTALLITSVWIRPDYVVYPSCFVVARYLQKKMPAWLLTLAFVLIAATSMLIRTSTYPWSTLYYHSFVTPVVDPATLHFHLTAGVYLHIAFRTLIDIWERFGGLALLLTLLAAGYRHNRILLAACVVGTGLHFLIFPSGEERFYLPLYLFASIMAAQRFTTMQSAYCDSRRAEVADLGAQAA